MLSILTLTLAASLCSGSCRDEELLAPRAVHPFQALLVTSDSLCARITVTVSGTSTVSSTWPSTASCTTNLVLIKGSTPKWAGSTRKLSLFVKLTNNSGGSLQLPIRLYLPTTGVTVLTPAGTPASTVVALNPDSSEAGGGRVWFTGGTGTLANKASTVLDTLLFTLQSPASQVRLSFVATANTAGGGGNPPPLPNTTATVPDDSVHTIRSPSDSTFQYFRTMAEVQFRTNATPQQIAALLTKYNAQVVGGSTWSNTYIIMYTDPGNTWAAVVAQLRLLESEPGVLRAMPMPRDMGPPALDTRYPSDGARLRRADWLSGVSDTVWALRAVRALQAWGCETGNYGGPLVRVGVADFGFDEGHPDLLPSRLAPPFRASIGGAITETTTQVKFQIYHGTMAAGVLTGFGDNDTGTVGTTWRTDLRLYDLGAQSVRRNYDEQKALEQGLEGAANDNLRILSFSIDVHADPDTFAGSRQMATLIGNVKKYLDAAPNTLIVKSSGNGGDGSHVLQKTVAEAKNMRTQALLAALMSLRDSSSLYKDRILIVGATQRDGHIWNGSTFVTGGGTDIMAPGRNVAVLGLREAGYPQSGNMRLDNGTSISAPMVAGVAAQLIAMDPSLTPAEVKQYLIDGAQRRLDPLSLGAPASQSTAVIGAPEPIYQLDAYSSLVQLSYYRGGTPICGLQVSTFGDGTARSLKLDRFTPQTVALDNSGSGYSWSNYPLGLSVAQGGRLLAVSAPAGHLVWDYSLVSGGWVRTAALTNTDMRTYLERDTAELLASGARRIRGKTYGSSWQTIDLPALVGSGGGGTWAQYAPDAKHAIFATGVASACGHAWLVTLPQGQVTGLRSPCPASNWVDVPSDAAWDPTATRFILAESYADNAGNVTGSYRAFAVTNDRPTQQGTPELENWYWPGDATGGYSGAVAEGHVTDADGVTATWLETGWWSSNLNFGVYDCEPVTRLASPPFTLLFNARYLAANDPQYPGYCQPSVQPLGRPGGVAALSPPSRRSSFGVTSLNARSGTSEGEH